MRTPASKRSATISTKPTLTLISTLRSEELCHGRQKDRFSLVVTRRDSDRAGWLVAQFGEGN
jgi:hypothetical protein